MGKELERKLNIMKIDLFTDKSNYEKFRMQMQLKMFHCDFTLWKFQMFARKLVELLPQRKGTKTT